MIEWWGRSQELDCIRQGAKVRKPLILKGLSAVVK